MTTPDQPTNEANESKPGKTRTWWHPLLASLLRWQLGDHYVLQEEVPVGLKPLQFDLFLIRKGQGELSETARKILAGLVERFGEQTFVEFKSPSDTLRGGDFQTFLAYVQLYRVQHNPVLDPHKMHLLVLAPKITKPYREELDLFGVTVEQEEVGVWRLHGGPAMFPMWLIETETLYGTTHPLLTLFSPKFLHNRVPLYEALHKSGYGAIVVYVSQQIRQFELQGKEYAMQHLGTEDEMTQVMLDLFATLPLEKRLAALSPEERLKGIAPEDRLRGLAVEERLRGLSPEDRLKGLGPEELERLKQLLQAQTKTDSSPPSQ